MIWNLKNNNHNNQKLIWGFFLDRFIFIYFLIFLNYGKYYFSKIPNETFNISIFRKQSLLNKTSSHIFYQSLCIIYE